MNQQWSDRPYTCTSCVPERHFKNKGGLASHRTTMHAFDDKPSFVDNNDLSPLRPAARNGDELRRMDLGDMHQAQTPQTPRRFSPGTHDSHTPQMDQSPTRVHPSPSRNTQGRTAYLDQQTDAQRGGDYRREWHPTISGKYLTKHPLINDG